VNALRAPRLPGCRRNAPLALCSDLCHLEAGPIRDVGGPTADVYGELTGLGFCALATRLNLSPVDAFLDIGSGHGQLVLAACKYGVVTSTGIEMSSTRHRAAIRARAASPRHVQRRSSLVCGNVVSDAGDVAGALAGATALYVSNLMFSDELNLQIARLLESLPLLRVVACIVPFESGLGGFTAEADPALCEMSWGSCTAITIYQRSGVFAAVADEADDAAKAPHKHRSGRRSTRRGVSMIHKAEPPTRVVSKYPSANMWCAPSFALEAGGLEVRREDLGVDTAFWLRDVISRSDAARMVAMAEQMGFDRGAGDEAERRNGALSWCFHDELLEGLMKRISPHVPWAVAVHAPGERPRDEHLPSLGGVTPWVRQVHGAPEGLYTLDTLNARARIYRYDPDSTDGFSPHVDEVWPAGRLTLGDGSREPTLNYDSWRYSPDADGEWTWAAGDRVSQLSVLLYLSEDFGGGETRLLPGNAAQVSVKPVTGSALCFGQSFKLGREVEHSAGALLHEGRPVISLPGRPSPLRPSPKYVLRTDICYTMPSPPPDDVAADDASSDDLQDPQAAQEMTIQLSGDVKIRRLQLAVLKEYGYDTSAWDE